MFRVLCALLIFILIRPVSYGQATLPSPAFKNGKLTAENGLLNHKTSHPLWQSTRFGSDYYVVVQMNQIADPSVKSELANNGIKLEQWLSGTNYLAVCSQGFSLKNHFRFGYQKYLCNTTSFKIEFRTEELCRTNERTEGSYRHYLFPFG